MSEPIDSLVQAYLDDELDAESKRRVDQALRENPEAARLFLQECRRRGLFQELPTPKAPDVSGLVVEELQRQSRRFRTSVRMSLAGALIAAAAVMVALLTFERSPDGRSLVERSNTDLTRPEAAGQPEPTSDGEAGPETETETNAADSALARAEDPEADPSAESVAERPPEATRVAVREPNDAEPDPRVRFLDRLVRLPRMREIALDLELERFDAVPDAVEELERIVAETSRSDPRYGRFRWTSADDGSRPAVAFAFVAREGELRNVLQRIQDAWPTARRIEPDDDAALGGLIARPDVTFALKRGVRGSELEGGEEYIAHRRERDEPLILDVPDQSGARRPEPPVGQPAQPIAPEAPDSPEAEPATLDSAVLIAIRFSAAEPSGS